MDEGVTSRKNKSITCANELCHACVTVGVMSTLWFRVGVGEGVGVGGDVGVGVGVDAVLGLGVDVE